MSAKKNCVEWYLDLPYTFLHTIMPARRVNKGFEARAARKAQKAERLRRELRRRILKSSPGAPARCRLVFAEIRASVLAARGRRSGGKHMKTILRPRNLVVVGCVLLTWQLTYAQGTRADYERAEQFLGRNLDKLVRPADITPHWVEESDQFWYRKPGADKEFLLVDAAKNTRGPAFDHTKLAAALSSSAGKEYRPNRLPFDTFAFVEKGTAIRFVAGEQQWTCDLA